MIYKEVYKGIKEYEVDIDKQEFIEWLNGMEPTKELLEDYVIDKLLPGEYPSYDDEEIILTEVEDADKFIESLNADTE